MLHKFGEGVSRGTGCNKDGRDAILVCHAQKLYRSRVVCGCELGALQPKYQSMPTPLTDTTMEAQPAKEHTTYATVLRARSRNEWPAQYKSLKEHS